MTLQSISLSSLQPPAANPRRSLDTATIEGLAASIETDGLLQNLVVTRGEKRKFRIVSGERRYRALKLLQKRKSISGSYKVPVEIREDLSDEDSLRLATIENVQRENLPPLDEAASFAALLHDGATLDDLAAKTGLSETTIRRRLVLNDLCEEAKEALAEKRISLAMAEALTLGSHDRQRDALDDLVRNPGYYSPAEIKSGLIDDRPTVAMAIFALEDYRGSITTDLFADGETSYFDDAEQFMELQTRAVETLAADYDGRAAWVEVTNSYRIPSWQYREIEDGDEQQGGVLINLSPTGNVEIRENLARPVIDEEVRSETADNPIAPKKARPAYSAPLCRHIAWQKSAAVASLLTDNPRKAKEIAIIAALDNLNPHQAFRFAAVKDAEGEAMAALEEKARLYAGWLGVATDDEMPPIEQLRPYPFDEVALYEALAALDDGQLDQLHMFIAAISFGQHDSGSLDTGESLFNRVATHLAADMRMHWQPDRRFFERRNRGQLLAVAEECGCAERHGIGMLRSFKKSELVSCLMRHFEQAFEAQEPDAFQQKAREWLPDAMRFPAADDGADE
jgi:ParB family chromosome partitioning protein